MPVATRQAMLRGVLGSERVIVGAYVDGKGGVCPMLAAHRCGGRTDFLSFARSWDRFAGARGKPRPASSRELNALVAQLEASLASASGLELDQAIADHRRLLAAAHRRRSALREEMDPRGEIIARRLSPPTRRPAEDTRAPARRRLARTPLSAPA
jgi:hypothetical protein